MWPDTTPSPCPEPSRRQRLTDKMLIKTLADEKYEVDVAETATVAEVKAKLEAMDIGAPADRSKIIFRGRVLADSAELSSLGIAPGDFMVLMKPKPAPAASAAAPVAAPTPPPAPAPAPEPEPAPAPPPAAPPGVDAAVVDSLVEMGFPRDAVVVALTAAFGNADRAAQYLFDPSSMPAESAPPAAPPPEATPLAAPPAAAPPTAAPAAPAATPAFTADNILAAIGGAAPAAPPPLTPLQRMLSEPRLMQCVTLARQDPSQLGPLLQQLSTEAPALLTLVQAHQVLALAAPPSPSSAHTPSAGGHLERGPLRASRE